MCDDGLIRCSECRREVDDCTAIKERWGYWSDGCGEVLPYCPECARREFEWDAPASGLVPLVIHGVGRVGESDSDSRDAF